MLQRSPSWQVPGRTCRSSHRRVGPARIPDLSSPGCSSRLSTRTYQSRHRLTCSRGTSAKALRFAGGISSFDPSQSSPGSRCHCRSPAHVFDAFSGVAAGSRLDTHHSPPDRRYRCRIHVVHRQHWPSGVSVSGSPVQETACLENQDGKGRKKIWGTNVQYRVLAVDK